MKEYEFRLRSRDGAVVVQLLCPICGVWGDLDSDQILGAISIQCPTEGCQYHETAKIYEWNLVPARAAK